MNTRFPLRTALVATLLLSATVLFAAGPEVAVTPIWRDGQLLVSFELTDGLTSDMVDAIQSGLPTSYAYDVEVRRGESSWFGRTLTSLTVTATVRFDNLTRRYQLTRTLGAHGETTSTTDNQDTVRRWLTRFDQLPVLTTTALEANSEYSVRVRVHTRPRNAWFWWPWDRGSFFGNAKFTFIP